MAPPHSPVADPDAGVPALDGSALAQAVGSAHVAVGISRLDDGVFVEVNDAFCRLFGYARDEVLGRTSGALGLWPEPARRDALLALLRREGGVTGYEARYRNRHGEVGDLAISASLFEHAGVTYMAGFLTEVSDRRELIDGLRAAHSRLGVALRATGLLVFRQDLALRYTWVANPALGVAEADALGRTDEELLGVEAAAPLVAIKRRVLDSGRAERRDVWVAQNGQLGCFDLVVEPERDAAGRVVAIVCAALDITARMTGPQRPAAAPDRGVPMPAIEGMASLIGREALSPRQRARLQRLEREVRRLAPPAPMPARPPELLLRQAHAGTLVLLAEHQPVLREMVAALLEAAGLRVAQAATGVEAFDLGMRLAPALLLLDMELPQRGGVAAARALRTMLPYPLPIVAMLSPGPEVGAADALDAELDDVIARPVTAEALYPKVLAWLERR